MTLVGPAPPRPSHDKTKQSCNMSLTYQPFAETPALDQLNEDLQMNVSERGRFVSAVLGAALGLGGLVRGGPSAWVCVALGGLLIHRGWTGKCAVYRELGIDERHGTPRAAEPEPRT